MADDGWCGVVGMVKDVGWQMPEPSEQAAMYHPALLQPGTGLNVAVRVHQSDGLRAATARTWRVPWTWRCRWPTCGPERQRPRRDPHLGGLRCRQSRRPPPCWCCCSRPWGPRPDVVHRRAPDARDRHSRRPGVAAGRQIVSGIFARAFLQVAVAVASSPAAPSWRRRSTSNPLTQVTS